MKERASYAVAYSGDSSTRRGCATGGIAIRAQMAANRTVAVLIHELGRRSTPASLSSL